MSLHSSLKTTSGALNQHRNVLTRAERIAKLAERGAFETDSDSPIGLVKVASRKVAKAKKTKTAKAEEGADEAKVS
jgi:small basic protein (TIGR04137 family)